MTEQFHIQNKNIILVGNFNSLNVDFISTYISKGYSDYVTVPSISHLIDND